MLRFFRINDPYRLLAVLILLTAMAMPIFLHPMPLTLPELKDMVVGELLVSGKTMYTQVTDDSPWLAAWISKVVAILFGRSILSRQILALLLIFFQASFFAFILIRNRAYNESNYLPAFIFGVLCFFSFDMLSLSRELLASTFLLLALNNIFKEIEFRVQRDEIVFNLGLYLGIASLLVFSYTIFLFGSILILALFGRTTIRKSLLLTFGFLFPHLALASAYYFQDGLHDFSRYMYGANFTLQSVNLISWTSILWLSGGTLMFFLFSLVMLNREARFTKYQSQLLQVMMVWLVVALIEVWLTRELSPHSLITFIPSFAYLINHYILLIRRKWIAEAMTLIFLFSIVGMSTAARLGKVKAIDYANLGVKESPYSSFIKNKRVFVVGTDWGIFRNNYPASFFLNGDLSREILNQPDYYENLIRVEDSFENDKPEIIIDEDERLAKFFTRLPDIAARYEKSGHVYLLKRIH